jgi:hypothetical protein
VEDRGGRAKQNDDEGGEGPAPAADRGIAREVFEKRVHCRVALRWVGP